MRKGDLKINYTDYNLKYKNIHDRKNKEAKRNSSEINKADKNRVDRRLRHWEIFIHVQINHRLIQISILIDFRGRVG